MWQCVEAALQKKIPQKNAISPSAESVSLFRKDVPKFNPKNGGCTWDSMLH
jgi:hypothetical protein